MQAGNPFARKPQLDQRPITEALRGWDRSGDPNRRSPSR
jgi:hypothetical protein